MTSKKETQARPFFRKSAAERLLESSLSPTLHTEEGQKNHQASKKELRKATGYYRPEQIRFMRDYCESLRKKFENEIIKPPLLQRVLLEIWDEEMARKVEAHLKTHGYDKRQRQ